MRTGVSYRWGFLVHGFYGEFAKTAVIHRKKRVVIRPGDISLEFHCSALVFYKMTCWMLDTTENGSEQHGLC